MRSRKLEQLQHRNYDGSAEEWTAILKHVLISKQWSGLSETIKRNLDVSCTISGKDPKATLSISIRTRVEGITQRLGGIELAQTQDTDNVDLFGWAGQSIERRDELENQILEEKEETSKSTTMIASLQAQLEDLTKAKSEHEAELLDKFAALLNEKKLRLRELNRQMSTAKIDKNALERLEASLGPSGSNTRQRGKKRPARDTEEANESDESDGFEAMDVDKPDEKEADSEDGRQTTDNESDTESNDEGDLDKPMTSQIEAGSDGGASTKKQQQSLPPPRNLPFTKQTKQPEKAKDLTQGDDDDDDDDETASEDDEL